MAKSRFNRRGPRPGRFFVYVLAGALILAFGGLAAEHGGPNFNGALVAGKAKPAQPAPPAPKPNNQNSPNNQSGPSSNAKTTPTASTTCSTAPAGSQCHVDKNGNGHVQTTTDAQFYGSGQPPACANQTNSPQDRTHCQKPPHKQQPNQCWYSQTNTQYHNGQATKTDTQYKVQRDNDHGNHDQKNEKCEASGETTAQ